jgi:hypothetical protein
VVGVPGPATPPVLISPLDGGAVSANATNVFKWGPVTGATSYALQVTASGAFSPIVNATGIVGASYTIPAGTLAGGTTYTWHVNATSAGGTSAWSTSFTFNTRSSSLVVFQPGGTWFIDTNRNGVYDTGIDWTNSPNALGRQVGDVPLTVDWDGDGRQELAIFRPGGTWFIDTNHSGVYDGPTVDWTNWPNTFGRNAGDVPLAIDWDGDSRQELAIFRPGGTWFIDSNHNGTYDPGVDWTNSPNTFGRNAGDVPLACDWNGDGRQELVIFRPGGTWFIDLNHNGTYDPGVDLQLGLFGKSAGDIPAIIDWYGNGTPELAIFRPSTATWYIDLNRDGTFTAGVDLSLAPFGNFAGAIPLTVRGW